MKRAIFYDIIRSASELFEGRLGRQQVGGMESILNAFAEYGDGRAKTLAYALATAFHETGSRMVPVREGFAINDSQARAIAANREYGAPAANGQVYYGRGHVQLTWEKNYRVTGEKLGIDLIDNPDLMLDPEVSARVLVEGMIDGRWNGNGKGIQHYLPDNGSDDLEGARHTVNIADNWSKIAGHYRNFLGAIEASGGVTSNFDIAENNSDSGNANHTGEAGPPSLATTLLPILIALIELAGKSGEPTLSGKPSNGGLLSGILNRLTAAGKGGDTFLTPVNAWLGEFIGRILDGRKTGFGLIGLLLTVILPILFPQSGKAILEALAPGATGTEQIAANISNLLTALFGALTTWGVIGKAEKWAAQISNN